MAPAGLNGSALVGCLARLGLVDGAAAPPSFVDGMGRWLGWADTIPLAAALNAAPAGPAAAEGAGRGARARARPAPAGLAAVERELARVQAALVRAIDDDGNGAARDPRSVRAAAATPAASAGPDFSFHRARCVELQQAMEIDIAPLRCQARDAVAARSPALARLAAIDAVLEDVLAAREQALLALMPALLQKRFECLRDAAAAAAGAGDGADTDAAQWLDVFRHDMKQLLRAELDLRLQPVLGLLEAPRAGP